MECDFCHEREAVIFVEQINKNGEKRKINMCMECAVAHGISPDPKNIETNIGDLFKELSDSVNKIKIENNKLCPVCGTKLSEIRKTSNTGCPECYEIFKAQIKDCLEKRGISGEYTGSMPARLSSFRSVLNYRIMLQNKLKDAVQKEDYEKAALYRDYLHALEKQPVSGEENDSSEEKAGEK